MRPVPPLVIASSQVSWNSQQAAMRRTLRELLGDFPESSGVPATTLISRESHVGFQVETFTFADGEGWETTGRCYIPDGPGPFPAVLWCHWHGGQYDVGIRAMDAADYTPEAPGPSLARRGYVVLGIDAPAFGTREGCGPDGTRGADGEASFAKHEMLRGRSSWGLTVHDDRLALSLLAARPDVDAARIGVAGISMGCLRTLWLMALDERPRCAVAIACLLRWQDLIIAGGLKYHGIYAYVPGLLRYFDHEGVVACIAPRPLLSINGELDPLAPVSGIRAIDAAVRPAWARHGAEAQLHIDIEAGVGHAWTPAMWQRSLAFFAQHLGGK